MALFDKHLEDIDHVLEVIYSVLELRYNYILIKKVNNRQSIYFFQNFCSRPPFVSLTRGLRPRCLGIPPVRTITTMLRSTTKSTLCKFLSLYSVQKMIRSLLLMVSKIRNKTQWDRCPQKP